MNGSTNCDSRESSDCRNVLKHVLKLFSCRKHVVKEVACDKTVPLNRDLVSDPMLMFVFNNNNDNLFTCIAQIP